MIKIVVRRQSAWCVKSPDEHITTGLTGKNVSFDFGPDWDGYVKTAIFEGSGESIPRLLTEDRTTIPAGCLTEIGSILRVGVYGTDGKVQTPTIYTVIDQIEDGADAYPTAEEDPALPIWAQLQAMIGDLGNLSTEAKNNLVAAINEAAKTGSGMSMQVKDGYIQYSADEGKTWRNLITLAELTGPAGPAGEKGDQGEQGPKGDKGEPGDPGPAYTLTAADKAEIIEDVLADLPEGGGGTGTPGKDGVSATHSWNGTVLTITSASGTSSADLRGPKGDKGDTGATGPAGPAYELTEADKQEIVEDVLAEMPEMPSGGGETVVWADDLLAEGVLAKEVAVNIENSNTGITFGKLREYKSFVYILKGTTNTGLMNLYLKIGDGTYTRTSNIDRGNSSGRIVIYEWCDTQRTVLKPVSMYDGNCSMVWLGSFAKTGSSNQISAGLGTSVPTMYIDLRSRTDEQPLFFTCDATPTIDYNYEIRGLTK